MPHHAEEPLTFHWPDHGDVSLALPAMLIVATLAHAAAFFLFKVATPVPGAPLVQSPVQITLIAPGLPGCDEALEWIGARDPIRESHISDVLPANILQPAYSASFARLRSAPEMAYAAPPPTRLPDIPMIAPNAAQAPPVPVAPSPPTASRLTFSPPIAARKLAEAPPLDLAHPAKELLKPARFLVAMEPDGSFGLVFRMESSGNPQIDAYVEQYLGNVRFDPSPDAARVWGFARFDFGSDAYIFPSQPTADPVGGPVNR
jgi:hypothetical protein